MSTLSERIKQYIGFKGISQAEFGKTLGRSEGWVNNTGQTLKFEQINIIKSKYPDLNIDWLINQKGEMMNKEIHVNKQLQVHDKKGVPYYDIDFEGGWNSSEIFSQQNPTYYISSPDFKRAEFACNLFGNSISSRIPSGAIIGLKQVNDWQTYFPTNELYAVVMQNELRTVKIVKRKDDTELILIPDPLDEHNRTGYDAETVPMDFVVSFFQVIAWGQFKRLVI